MSLIVRDIDGTELFSMQPDARVVGPIIVTNSNGVVQLHLPKEVDILCRPTHPKPINP